MQTVLMWPLVLSLTLKSARSPRLHGAGRCDKVSHALEGLDVPAEVDQSTRRSVGNHAPREIHELGLEVAVTHRALEAADGVLDKSVEPAAILQRDCRVHLLLADRRIDSRGHAVPQGDDGRIRRVLVAEVRRAARAPD